MLFLVFTAEEKGLLGSRILRRSPYGTGRQCGCRSQSRHVHAHLCVEETARAGLEQSTLADQARAVGSKHGIEIAGDPEPDRNSFIRTDQYSFVQAGVPALAMKFGWEAGSPEYRAWRGMAEPVRYHPTDDDLTQPVDLAAAAQFNRFFADLARAVANDDVAPALS